MDRPGEYNYLKMNVDQLEYLFSNINRWISNADGKINIFVGIQIAVMGLLFSDFSKWYQSKSPNFSSPERLLVVSGLILVIWSIYHSLKGIFPNLRSRGENGELVYFGSIARHSLKSFRKIISKSDKEQYTNDLVEQIYTNSHIAKDKFESYKKAVMLFFSGISILIYMLFAV